MSEFIRRSSFPEGYANIPQAVFKTEGMSFEAIGLQAYLLSLPDKWVVRDTQLRKKGNLGATAFRRIVRELEGFGWLRVTQSRGKDTSGRYVFQPKRYVIFDLPKKPKPISGVRLSASGKGSTL
jgi:hypothetical protein